MRICQLCGAEIKDYNDETYVQVSLYVLEEITGQHLISGATSAHRFFHSSCLSSLDNVTYKRLTQKDWKWRILNTDFETWVELDQEGNPIFETLRSDIPKIDQEIQRLKKKGKMSNEEKEWLERMIN